MAVNLFIRQPFTESGENDRNLVQGVLDVVNSLSGNPVVIDSLTGFEAQSESTFRQSFERETGLAYTPAHFRSSRLALLEKADAFLYIRTGFSESGGFEVAYNIFKGRKSPLFFAIWKHAPMRQTFLMDLDSLCDVEYVYFDKPEELRTPLAEFFSRVEREQYSGPSII